MQGEGCCNSEGPDQRLGTAAQGWSYPVVVGDDRHGGQRRPSDVQRDQLVPSGIEWLCSVHELGIGTRGVAATETSSRYIRHPCGLGFLGRVTL